MTAPLYAEGELQRYARHIVLREIGGPGQARLKRASVLVVGAGGLGAPVLLYLAAAGVGRITVVDDDTVSLSNLQRQIIHSQDRLDMPKVASAKIALAGINPHVSVTAVQARLDGDCAPTLVSGHDLVIDATDNLPTRHLLNAACVAGRVPLLSGAISQWEGQVTVYDPARGAPYLSCLFPTIPADDLVQTCAGAGVMGALPGIIGAMMAAEAIKLITDAGRSLRGRLLLQDVLWGENREIAIHRRDDCLVCGVRAGGGDVEDEAWPCGLRCRAEGDVDGERAAGLGAGGGGVCRRVGRAWHAGRSGRRAAPGGPAAADPGPLRPHGEPARLVCGGAGRGGGMPLAGDGAGQTFLIYAGSTVRGCL